MLRVAAQIAALALATSCAGTPKLVEATPVIVTAATAAPAPKPVTIKHVTVKQDRIDVSEAIHFEPSSWKISDDSDAILDEIAAVIVKHAELEKMRVEGHTDNQGDAAHNTSLSKKRANAVVKYLVEHGVDADRLTAEGYGDSKPIASNATEDGRAKNRRVVFVIVSRSKTAPKGGGDDDDGTADQ